MSAIFLVLIYVNCEILLTIITAIKKERQWPNLMKNMKIVKKKIGSAEFTRPLGFKSTSKADLAIECMTSFSAAFNAKFKCHNKC